MIDMKYLLAFFVSITFSTTLYCQANEATRIFVRSAINKKHIVYSIETNDDILKDIIQYLTRDTIYARPLKRRKNDSFDDFKIILTKNEKDSIKTKLSTLKSFDWGYNLMPKSIFLSPDSLRQILDVKSKGWDYFKRHYRKGLYSFSKPIFIRNQSICFFYLDYTDGNFNDDGLGIWVKAGNKWKHRYVIFSNVF